MHGAASRSAFLSPVVWMLALIVGLGGFGQFTVTYFVPSVAKALYGLDATAAGVIISTGYLTAIVVNLGVGLLADRFNKLVVLGAVFIMLSVASASLAIENLLIFRVATATVIGFGFTAANQLYGLAGAVMPRHEAGHAMGVVSLGAGLFGYFGPQMLGILRDLTGSFAAGFYMVADRRRPHADSHRRALPDDARSDDNMNRQFVTCICALVALNLTISAQAPSARATGDQRRQYVFAPTGQQMPYRVYVPKTWDGKASLPIILMLHGAGANEGTYLDQADGLLMKLAEQHGYIVVSPLGFTPLGAYGNPLRLPAVFGQTAAAASQRAAVTPARQRELNLSELEVMTALEIVTEEYGADRSRTYLAGHSMGSGGAWHLAARYPERWRAVAPMSGPFVDEATYPFDRIRRLPIFMTEGTGATPSLEGSRVLARYMRERGFAFEYLEVDGNHGSMVPMVWPRIFEFFNRQGSRTTCRSTAVRYRTAGDA